MECLNATQRYMVTESASDGEEIVSVGLVKKQKWSWLYGDVEGSRPMWATRRRSEGTDSASQATSGSRPVARGEVREPVARRRAREPVQRGDMVWQEMEDEEEWPKPESVINDDLDDMDIVDELISEWTIARK
jgi:hypothetical protein